jgi:hypothetical protein
MNLIAYVDHLLRNREQVIVDLQNPKEVSGVTRISFAIFAILSAAYGLVMGSQSWIHGYGPGWLYSLSAMLKLPFLFLFTLAICLPLLYVLNVLIEPRAQWKVIFGVLIASLTVTSIVLASCSLILAFFMLSTKSYAFITLLNTGIFTLAGLYGVWFLGKALHMISENIPNPLPINPHAPNVETPPSAGKSKVATIMTWWLIAYAIVGTQMAWLMRPFIGSPGMPFSFLRPQEANFYIAIGRALSRLFTG